MFMQELHNRRTIQNVRTTTFSPTPTSTTQQAFVCLSAIIMAIEKHEPAKGICVFSWIFIAFLLVLLQITHTTQCPIDFGKSENKSKLAPWVGGEL